jgi:hypothetical protein
MWVNMVGMWVMWFTWMACGFQKLAAPLQQNQQECEAVFKAVVLCLDDRLEACREGAACVLLGLLEVTSPKKRSTIFCITGGNISGREHLMFREGTQSAFFGREDNLMLREGAQTAFLGREDNLNVEGENTISIF